MGTNEIRRKIKDEANVEREKILSEAKEKAEEMIREAREETEVQNRGFIEAEEEKGVEEKERIIRAARLNARKLRWDAEEEMIEKVLEGAMKRIEEVKKEGFNGNSYSNILSGLIKEAAISIIAGESADTELEVKLSEEDAAFVKSGMLKKISDEINQDVGVNVNLSVSGERIKSVGGVTISVNDGKIEVNNTFEQRMVRFSTGLKEDIINVLFKE